MQKIVDKYNTIESPYLLPIIKNNGKDPRREYKNASHLINRKLKVIGQMLEIPVTLTTYVARHAWANIAKSKISLSRLLAKLWDMTPKTQHVFI